MGMGLVRPWKVVVDLNLRRQMHTVQYNALMWCRIKPWLEKIREYKQYTYFFTSFQHTKKYAYNVDGRLLGCQEFWQVPIKQSSSNTNTVNPSSALWPSSLQPNIKQGKWKRIPHFVLNLTIMEMKMHQNLHILFSVWECFKIFS